MEQRLRFLGVVREAGHEDFVLREIFELQIARVGFHALELPEGIERDFEFSQIVYLGEEFFKEGAGDAGETNFACREA